MYIEDYCLYEMNQKFAEQTYIYDFNGKNHFMDFSEQEFYYCLHQLCYKFDEFQNENRNKDEKGSCKCPNTREEIKRQFRRSDGGGLLKNIKDKIHLDLEIKKTDSRRERFDKFRLLKLIYAAEKLGVYQGELKSESVCFMNRCSILDIIAEPKSIYMYNNYDDSFLEEFEVIYDHVRDAVENAEEIESTIDDLYENWSLMIVISYLGVGISSVYRNKLSEIRKQRNAIEKIAFHPSHFLSEQDGVGNDLKVVERHNAKMCTGVIERFFVMLVTARKRAEINDQLSIKFACKKKQDTSYNAMDKRVARELLENDFYKKEVSFEEFTKLLQFGRDEERRYLWRGITSKYDPVIPEKEFFQSRGEFSKIKKYMKHVIEPVFSFKDARSTVCQWCKLFKSVYDGMRYEGTLTTYNWKGTNVKKTFPAIFKSYNTDRNVKSLSPDAENKHLKRTERADRRELHSTMILRAFFHNCEMQMYSSPEIVECRNAIKKHMLLTMKKSFSCSFQTLNDVRKANSMMQFVFMMHMFSDEILSVMEEQLKFSFLENFGLLVNQILHKKYAVLNPIYVPQIVHQKYNISFKNEIVKRRLLSILTIQSMNTSIDKNFEAFQLVIMELCHSVVESQDSFPTYNCKKIFLLNPLYYMCIFMEIYITVNHINRTITINDCTFKKPYEQELEQYM